MSDDARRHTILDVASRLFRHYGPTKTTMVDIAREAKLGVGTLYLVFPSKESIVEELSASVHLRVLAAMRSVAAARAERGLAVRLGAVLDVRTSAFQELASQGAHACELVHCAAVAVKSAHTQFQNEEHALLCTILEEAREARELAKVDVARTATTIQRAYATLTPPRLFELPADEAKRATRDMCRLLVLGVLRREEP